MRKGASASGKLSLFKMCAQTTDYFHSSLLTRDIRRRGPVDDPPFDFVFLRQLVPFLRTTCAVEGVKQGTRGIVPILRTCSISSNGFPSSLT